MKSYLRGGFRHHLHNFLHMDDSFELINVFSGFATSRAAGVGSMPKALLKGAVKHA